MLIDEGQDLVHEEPELTFDEKQAFYWMAYQSLRPVARDALLDTGEPEARRLIWAYDEAQSLDTLTIPSTRALSASRVRPSSAQARPTRAALKSPRS
ncbi:hypothetical protein [Deinococcus cavernae]|uniref:hypothetical protein n=1 Tax=Deinococcus cavernae TaxID=2320857 RepID=UPI001F457622|nr:hypothetical protein [Deinococcus cavernae]